MTRGQTKATDLRAVEAAFEVRPFVAVEAARITEGQAMNPNTILNRWAQGIDYCVAKVGRQWAVTLAPGFPLYATKRAAYEAATVCAIEARRKAVSS
jgi:hypothetical protein